MCTPAIDTLVIFKPNKPIMNTLYEITESSLLTDSKTRGPNWHCVIKPINSSDHRLSIDIWGHSLSRKETEDIAIQIVDSLNDNNS